MKIQAISAILLAAAPFYSTVATAQPGRYLGVDLAHIAVETESGQKSEPRGLRIRTGLRINKYLDAELMIGGSTKGEGDIFDEYATTYAASYLKGYASVTPKTAAYILVGASFVEVTQTINDTYFSDNDAGLSYGAGFEALMYENVNITADYIVYALGSGSFPEVSGLSLGLKWNF